MTDVTLPPQNQENQKIEATLLIVEDDIHLLRGIRDILELEGYRVLMASNGVEGLEVLNSMLIPPDLIISDIMMPRMTGYEFFEAVRAQPDWIEVPFIFLTAKGEKSDIRKGKRMGVDDYVVKPMDPEDLLVAVENKLERARVTRTIHNQQVATVKRQILTILNHEFRTPLTYVVAYADMLDRDAEDLSAEEMRSFLRGLNAGADRLSRLVENFITLVELETGEAQQNFSWRRQKYADVDFVLAQVVENHRPIAEEHGVALRLEAPGTIPEILIDPDYFRIMLTHLLDNAIKFSDKPDSEVLLRGWVEDGGVYFSVIDHGRGIAEDQLGHIWEPFYQINRAKFEDQGSGAGLPIVKGVAQMHHAEIELQSAPEQGTTVTICLPLAADVPLHDPLGDTPLGN